MLSFAEELLLLALDEEKGVVRDRLLDSNTALEPALVGALLMELAFLGRIDTDPQSLFVVRPAPTGNPLLDEILAVLQEQTAPEPIGFWLQALANRPRSVQDRILEALTVKGILRCEENRILWVFRSRSYPVNAPEKLIEVEERLRALIMGDDLPDPRDAVLVSLVHACGLFEELLSPREYRRYVNRIEQIARLDLVGQAVAETITRIRYEAILMRAV